jgi:integration host factor subunit beta
MPDGNFLPLVIVSDRVRVEHTSQLLNRTELSHAVNYLSHLRCCMTKAELVEGVADAAELTKKDAERLVEIVFESIIETLNQGEKIELRGFGSFRVRERGARRGRNPKTGDPVSIPAKRVPYFKPGKELKELINENASARVAPESPSAATDDSRQPPVL